MGTAFIVNRTGGLDQVEADSHPFDTVTRSAAYLGLANNLNSQGSPTFKVDNGTKTATASAGAATLNKQSGQITSESLTTAAGVDYTLTLTNANILATSLVFASVQLGTSTTGEPAITSVTPAAGSVVINVRNIHATAAFNGTVIVSFLAANI